MNALIFLTGLIASASCIALAVSFCGAQSGSWMVHRSGLSAGSGFARLRSALPLLVKN